MRAGDRPATTSTAAAQADGHDAAARGPAGLLDESSRLSHELLDVGSGTAGVGTYLYLAPEARRPPRPALPARRECAQRSARARAWTSRQGYS